MNVSKLKNQSESETNTEGEEGSVSPLDILIAEDNVVTQDLLELLLTDKGHKVDIVSDGTEALEALGNKSYDVVLMDFHLPNMDGLQVAARIKDNLQKYENTRFIALTADMEGLISHPQNCEHFDDLLPKPFELEEVTKIVEAGVKKNIPMNKEKKQSSKSSENAQETTHQLEMAPTLIMLTKLQELGNEFLVWPDDFDGERLSARAIQASLDPDKFDAIIVHKPTTIEGLALIWATKALHVLPLIDLTGKLGPMADWNGTKLDISESKDIKQLTDKFRARRQRLNHDILYSKKMSDKLLTRAFVCGGKLQASYNPGRAGFISYNAVLERTVVNKEASELCDQGYFSREFYDRFHVCNRCNSSRFNMREECPKCHSSGLSEDVYIRHLGCNYLGLRSEFEQNKSLICPVCEGELLALGEDYDKTGTAIRCPSCEHISVEPSIGMLCLDCGAHSNKEQPGTHIRDVYSFILTDKAHKYLEIGENIDEEDEIKTLFLKALPLALNIALVKELKRYKEDQHPFTLLDISYDNVREVDYQHGPRKFRQVREQFLRNFEDGLKGKGHIIRGQNYDYVILQGVHLKEIDPQLKEIVSESCKSLRPPLEVSFNLFGPEDFL